MSKPVCVPCQRFMRMRRQGYYFLEGMPRVAGAQPGLREPEAWRPYKLWAADLWECPDCGAQVLTGFGAGPINEHYRPDFPADVARYGADQLLVKDC